MGGCRRWAFFRSLLELGLEEGLMVAEGLGGVIGNVPCWEVEGHG